MKALAYLLSVLAVIGLAYWAYNENYATQNAMKEGRQVAARITRARERLAMLADEWAYQNRPDRLRALVLANYDALGLDSLSPDSFGSVEQVAFPPPPVPSLPVVDPDAPVMVGSAGARIGEEPL